MDMEVMVFSPLGISGMMSACENTDASTMRTAFPASDLARSSAGSSATPRLASSSWNGREKNSVWYLRGSASNVLRPQGAPGPRSSLRRYAGVPGDPGPPRPVQTVREGEAGGAGVSRRQPLLHEAVRLLRRPALPRCQHPRHRPGGAPGLAHGQGTGEAVHARAAATRRQPGPQDHRRRRGVARAGRTFEQLPTAPAFGGVMGP